MYCQKLLPPLLLLLVILGSWELLVRFLHMEPWLLPTPSVIITSFIENRELLWTHSLTTLLEALLGLGLGIIGALIFAIAMDLFAWVGMALRPLLVMVQAIPVIAVAPLFIVWFGYDLLPKVLVVGLVTFFPILINTIDSLWSTDEEMIRIVRAMGASRWQLFVLVRLPASLPAFFSGLKLAAAYAVLGAVIAEWLGASEGLGVFLIRALQSFAADTVFVVIIMITAWSLLFVLIVDQLERLFMPWRFQDKGENI